MKYKKGVVLDYLPWIIISVAVLVIVLIGLVVLKDKGINILDSIKSMFSGGY
ncbi:MAG: hypothetical protein ACOC3Z_03095 [Nanoarchaeota archaeon]